MRARVRGVALLVVLGAAGFAAAGVAASTGPRTLLAVLDSVSSSSSTPAPDAIVTNPGCTGTPLAANDDSSSPQVALPFPINFFGTQYSSLYVNNNGNVTFTGPLSQFTPDPIVSVHQPLIAPFWADVDTRGPGSGVVQYGDISAGATEVGGRQAFCVNWVDVGYFGSHTDKLNSFQLVLIDRSDTGAGNFDIEFNYDKVQWETGDASGGSDGLGGHSARAGYSSGSQSFELDGSGVAGSFLDSSSSGLVHDSIGSQTPGRYVFPVRNGIALGHSLSGSVVTGGEAHVGIGGAVVQACPTPDDTPCRLATTHDDGSYTFPNLPDAASGALDHSWALVASPPPGSQLAPATGDPVPVHGSDATAPDLVLEPTRPLPTGASIRTAEGVVTSGTPTVFSADTITLTVPGCTGGSGTATLTLQDGTTETATLAPSEQGLASGSFAAPGAHVGLASVAYTICDATESFDLYVDPSGIVQTADGTPVSGATVTLLRADDPGGPFTAVPDGSAYMSPGNRANPSTTGASGRFGWDVLYGYYEVQATKDGCATATSDSFAAPVANDEPTLTLDCAASSSATATTETTTTAQTTTTAETTTEAATTAPPPPPAPAPPPPPRSSVSVAMSAPADAQVGDSVTFTARVSNGGPDTSTGVVATLQVPAGATLSSSQGGCSGTTCTIGTLGSGASATITAVVPASTAGTLTVSASVQGDYDSSSGDNSSSASVPVVAADAPPPAPPAPASPGTFNALETGTVMVNGTPQPAGQVFQLKSGDDVDVSGGVITFTASDGSFGSFSGDQITAARRVVRRRVASASADQAPAEFTVQQDPTGGATTLVLAGGDFSACGTAPRRTAAADAKPKPPKSTAVVRQLWGSAKGHFRTQARFSSATIRGTVWLTEDRCDGSYTQAVVDVVDVFDSVLGKTVSLQPGESYLARPPATPRAATHARNQHVVSRGQTAATVRRHGLRWAGRTFTTRTAFGAWLARRGGSWSRFRTQHAKLAAALASRG